MDYTFCLPPGALGLVISLEATIGGPWETLVLSCLVSPSEVTADLAENKELISSVKGRKGSISGFGAGGASSAERGEITSSGEMNP